MTHVQKFWTNESITDKLRPTFREDIETIRLWMKKKSSLPNHISDEQILLFLHSNYYDLAETKKTIESYYKLKKNSPQLYANRDIHRPNLKKALDTLYYGIFPEKTPEGFKIVFHMLNDTNPSNYKYDDGFKLLVMMLDLVYAKEGPGEGLVMLFDLKGVKLGHITRLSINSIRKSLEYLQDAIPLRLKAIHVVNVHSIIDKIMMLIKPFINKKFLELLHFHKENSDDIYKFIPKRCLPINYGGDLDSVYQFHQKFIEEMESSRPLFLEEDELFFGKDAKGVADNAPDFDLQNLNID